MKKDNTYKRSARSARRSQLLAFLMKSPILWHSPCISHCFQRLQQQVSELQPQSFHIQVHLGLSPPVPLHLSSASCRRGFSCVCAWCSLAGPITGWASPCHSPPPHIAPHWVYKPTSRRPRRQIQGTCLADCGGPGHAPAFRKRCGEPFFVPVVR